MLDFTANGHKRNKKPTPKWRVYFYNTLIINNKKLDSIIKIQSNIVIIQKQKIENLKRNKVFYFGAGGFLGLLIGVLFSG